MLIHLFSKSLIEVLGSYTLARLILHPREPYTLAPFMEPHQALHPTLWRREVAPTAYLEGGKRELFAGKLQAVLPIIRDRFNHANE